jgi:hypothetical protein
MKKSLLIYIMFILVASAGIIYGSTINYPNLRLWEFQNILLLLIGVPFLFLLPKANLKFSNGDELSTKQEILIPACIGIFFGLLDLLVIEFILPHEKHTSLPPYTQPFPYSIFLYFSGALEIELFYRLIPIAIILFAFNKFKEGKYFNQAFFVAAILTSIREPLEQMPGSPGWFIVYSLITGFAMNYLQAYFFKTQSFISSLSIRLGHYLIWHVLNGIVIQYMVL